jgi:hypothetical protein
LSVPYRTLAQQADLNSLVAPVAQEISKGHERKIAVLPLISRIKKMHRLEFGSQSKSLRISREMFRE